MAERVRRYANTMFNWATSEDIIDVPPTYKLKARAPKTSRERVLNVEEIRKIWMACDVFRDGQTSYGSFIQMLFLTAQRRNEIALMQRDEIDLEKSCYTIPAWRNKSARTHEVPLSPRAIRIITQRLANATSGARPWSPPICPSTNGPRCSAPSASPARSSIASPTTSTSSSLTVTATGSTRAAGVKPRLLTEPTTQPTLDPVGPQVPGLTPPRWSLFAPPLTPNPLDGVESRDCKAATAPR